VYRDDSELSTEQLEQGGVGENSNGKFGGEEDEDEVYIEHQADDFRMQACMSNICAAPAYADGSFSSRKGDAKPVESGQSKPTNLENFAIRCIFGDSNPAPQQQPRESCIRSEAAALGSVERKQVRGERNSNDSALREEDLRDELSSALCITQPNDQLGFHKKSYLVRSDGSNSDDGSV
jgi:hypothetical protein